MDGRGGDETVIGRSSDGSSDGCERARAGTDEMAPPAAQGEDSGAAGGAMAVETGRT